MKIRSNRMLISAVAIAFLSLIFLVVTPGKILADGDETLGAPSIVIQPGSGVVSAGVGLESQPGQIKLYVPGEIVQVLLYWLGRGASDDSITVDGTPVTGTQIGFSDLNDDSTSFRADITNLNLVNPGMNSLSVSGMDFTHRNNGAGVIVVFDDATVTAEIDIRDGNDFVYISGPTPESRVSVLQTFNFGAEDSDRTAKLTLFAGDGTPTRPDIIKVTVGGDPPIEFCNELIGNVGASFDVLELAVDVPAGASELTVEAISNFCGGLNSTPESLGWMVVGLSVEIEQPGIGRMTGGGGQIWTNDKEVRITRGFTIHCDIVLSNNLEINWPDNKWHIDKPLTSAFCTDCPDVNPEPPPAPFDTFFGEGIGRLNGEDGSIIRFIFQDAGEPGGKQDKAQIAIWAPGADPDIDAPVLFVPFDFLDHGNLQAHFDQPHK